MTIVPSETVRPEAVTPTVSASRRKDIQGLRAVAVLLVIVFHAGLPVPGGFTGVDVFFVISGFVITGLLAREWAATGRVRFGRFYARRFRRLTPALAVTVTVTLIGFAFLGSPLVHGTAAATGAGAMLLASNAVIASVTGGYFDAAAETNPLLNMWSLSVEEQFYLLFPVLLVTGWAAVRRLMRGHHRHVAWAAWFLVAIVGVGSFALAVAGARGWGADESWAWWVGFYSPLTRAWEFAAGAALFLATSSAVWDRGVDVVVRRFRPAMVATALGVMGAALLGWAAVGLSESTPWPGVRTLIPVTGTVLLIAAGSVPGGWLSRLLSSRPFVLVGDMSYSLYLWHWPVIVLAVAAFPTVANVAVYAAALSVIPAVASYRYVESPVRFASGLAGVRPMAVLVVVTLLVPLATAGWLWNASRHAADNPSAAYTNEFMAAVVPWHAGHEAGCDRARPPSFYAEDACWWNKDMTGEPIYLIGDSNADQYTEAVAGAGALLRRPVRVTTSNSCPLLYGGWFTQESQDRAWNVRCRNYQQKTVEELLSAPVGTVVIGATDGYWTDDNFTYGLTKETATTDVAVKQPAMVAGLTAAVRALTDAGHQVVMLLPIPRWVGATYKWDPTECSGPVVRSGECRQSVSVETLLADQQQKRDLTTRAVVAGGGKVIDPIPVLCPDGVCSTTDPTGMIKYRDKAHLSVRQSTLLADWMAEQVRDAAFG